MKVLVLGNGGREHALAWRIAKDKSVSQVFLHPGNAGTWKLGLPALKDVSIDNPEAIAQAAKRQGVSLIVIGPEVLLARDYATFFRSQGFDVSGPGKDGAQLETSKAFAKRFMESAGVPTARYVKADSANSIRKAVGDRYPIVLKLDGLAAGKGVVVAENAKDVEGFIERVWKNNEFGLDAHSFVIEDFLPGRELSYIGLCDGKAFLPLSSASDYKRLNDGQKGPNTGGMGAISPSPILSPELEARIQEQVVQPTLKQLQKQGIDYRGALYFGIMVSEDGTPYVLEFNARFGDPETQALMLRIQGDFTALLLAAAKGELEKAPKPDWANDCAVYVVATAKGYPSVPRAGDKIEGWKASSESTQVFFSGVGARGDELVTQGGRVLGIGALAANAKQSREKAYSALSQIQWADMHYRRDIGA